jgi:hypothetical protein
VCTPWSPEEIENFKKNWPHLKNFSDSVLKNATLSELTGMARQKLSGSKLLSQILSTNFEQIQNFPEKVEAGLDDCVGKAHPARFLRGYVGDAQELWLQAREKWGIDGIDPISNYEVVSVGLGDLLTPIAWSELHKPQLQAVVHQDAFQQLGGRGLERGDKSDPLKEFETMQEFRVAIATLDGGFQKVMPWNMSFKTLSNFMISINYGEADLPAKSNKLVLLANFVDE